LAAWQTKYEYAIAQTSQLNYSLSCINRLCLTNESNEAPCSV